MDKSCWKPILVLLVLFISTYAEATRVCSMEIFIGAVKLLEDENPGLEPVAILKRLRLLGGLNDGFTKLFLADTDSNGIELNPSLTSYIRQTVHHRILEDGREEGVVLTSDGITVALKPLLFGIEAGFRSKFRGLFQLTLLKDLSRSLLHGQHIGSDGCWDSFTSPQVFTLSHRAVGLTAAQINGGMDGFILGKEVYDKSIRPLKLSSLLTEYYSHQMDDRGVDDAPLLISKRRRENFKGLVNVVDLARNVIRSVGLQEKHAGRSKMETKKRKQLMATVKEGIKEFVREYIDCPPIIPRCMWGAEPYRGTPTNLSLPLASMFIHHTYLPSEPCLTFQQCSADMRSMQRFHQEDRGWDDIGYSFVAGTDGNIYEGRGWHWQGAHTLGHNSKGYGVSFIGDYTNSLPSQHSMKLVRHQLASCAVSGGRLLPAFTLKGHRQLVNTSCPGDALYEEIKSWEHFEDVKKSN